MAKQTLGFTLSETQVRAALHEYAARMIDATAYDLQLSLPGGVTAKFIATKKRAPRKPKAATMLPEKTP